MVKLSLNIIMNHKDNISYRYNCLRELYDNGLSYRDYVKAHYTSQLRIYPFLFAIPVFFVSQADKPLLLSFEDFSLVSWLIVLNAVLLCVATLSAGHGLFRAPSYRILASGKAESDKLDELAEFVSAPNEVRSFKEVNESIKIESLVQAIPDNDLANRVERKRKNRTGYLLFGFVCTSLFAFGLLGIEYVKFQF